MHAAQFDVGDFFLVAKKESKDGRKLRLKWFGPRPVTRAISEHMYEFQGILTETLALFHSNRLKFYADSQFNVTK